MHARVISHGQIIRISNLKLSTLFCSFFSLLLISVRTTVTSSPLSFSYDTYNPNNVFALNKRFSPLFFTCVCAQFIIFLFFLSVFPCVYYRLYSSDRCTHTRAFYYSVRLANFISFFFSRPSVPSSVCLSPGTAIAAAVM